MKITDTLLKNAKSIRENMLAAVLSACVLLGIFFYSLSTRSAAVEVYAQKQAANLQTAKASSAEESTEDSSLDESDEEDDDDEENESTASKSSGSASKSKSSSSSKASGSSSSKSSSSASKASSSSKSTASKETAPEPPPTHQFASLNSSHMGTVATEFLRLADAHRTSLGLPAFERHSIVSQAASIRGGEIAGTQDFSSIESNATRPNYSNFWTVYSELGFTEPTAGYSEQIAAFVYEGQLEDCNLSNPTGANLNALAASLFMNFLADSRYSWAIETNRSFYAGACVSVKTYHADELPKKYSLKNETQLVLVLNIELVEKP